MTFLDVLHVDNLCAAYCSHVLKYSASFFLVAGSPKIVRVHDGVEGVEKLEAWTSKELVISTNEADAKLWVSLEAECNGETVEAEVHEGYSPSSPVLHACGKVTAAETTGGGFFVRLKNSTTEVKLRYFSKRNLLPTFSEKDFSKGEGKCF